MPWRARAGAGARARGQGRARRHRADTAPAACWAATVQFLAANLYARSIFGEDALANLCIESTAEGKIAGHVRIRSKTQASPRGRRPPSCSRGLAPPRA